MTSIFFKRFGLLFVLASILFSACKKDEDITPTCELNEETGWQPTLNYGNYDKIFLNGHLQEGRLTLASPTSVTVLNDTTWESNWGDWGNVNFWPTPVLGDRFALYGNDHNLELRLRSNYFAECNMHGSASALNERIDLVELDSSLFDENVKLHQFGKSEIGKFNDNGDFLFATKWDKNGPSSIYILNMNIDISEFWAGPCLSIDPEVRKLRELPSMTTHVLEDIITVGTDWYVIARGHPVLKIDEDGNVSESSFISESEQSLYELFTYKDKIYGVGGWNRLYESVDGLNWNLALEDVSWTFSEIVQIGDSLCSYRTNFPSISTINLETGETRELDITNLESEKLSSMHYFRDEVWISTMNGLYSKSLEEFFESKVEE